MSKILEITDLKKHYPVTGGVLQRKIASVKALDGIDLNIQRGECLGLVGESGCGKTTTGKALVRLHRPTEGKIYYYASANQQDEFKTDIAQLHEGALKRKGIRAKFQMVFQDPTTSLNPRMLIKNIIAEPLKTQNSISARDLEARVLMLLSLVGLTKDHYLRYPHEFSGGQRQRIAVARAIATHPDFIVLDEPTSALDVSVQAQILNLLMELQQKLSLTFLFITHHLLVVKYISQRLAVMYLGKIVEVAPTGSLFKNPLHPYTHALLSGIPVPDTASKARRIVLIGDVPSPLNPPKACRFHTRCPFVMDICREKEPVLEEIIPGHMVACHRKLEVEKLVLETFGHISY